MAKTRPNPRAVPRGPRVKRTERIAIDPREGELLVENKPLDSEPHAGAPRDDDDETD